MLNRHNDKNFTGMFDGVEIKTTVYGKQSLMSEFRMKAGSMLPEHAHDSYEQTGYLVSGKIVLIIDGQRHDIAPGDSWCIPAGAAHSAEISEDAVAIEVFTYPREDYVKLLDPESR